MSQETIIASLISRVDLLEKIVVGLQETIRAHCNSPHLPARDVLMNTTYGIRT